MESQLKILNSGIILKTLTNSVKVITVHVFSILMNRLLALLRKIFGYFATKI